MKICFLTAWPLGLQGTPGTYLFLQKIINYADALVVAPVDDKNTVYSLPNTLPVLPAENLREKDGLGKVLPALSHFDPDIFYVFNFPEWPQCINALKSAFPDKKFVLDVKTPLLADGERKDSIQRDGIDAAKYLDIILTLSCHSVKTWLPEYECPVREYPLGIDISLFPEPSLFYQRQHIKKIVYIGSFSPKRKIDKLVDCFLSASENLGNSIQLDLYGRGPDEGRLRALVSAKQKKGKVNIQGLISQKELFVKLSDYDAGIAWVPNDIFSESPSLKILEYMASGLPVLASNTIAHRNLSNQADCKIHLFENTPVSFGPCLSKLMKNGSPLSDIVKNRKSVERFDYNRIINDFIFPALKDLSPRKAAPVIIDKLQDTLDYTGAESGNSASSLQESKCSLKLLIHCNSLAMGKGGAEKTAMNLAIEMGKRGHLVYMAYRNTGLPAYAREKGIVLLPYDSFEQLSEDIRRIDPDVYFVFYFNEMLIQFYSLVHNSGIPFGMQECTNPYRLITNNWRTGDKKSLSNEICCWQRELIASAANRIRLTMPRYKESFPDYIQLNVRPFSNPAFPQQRLADPGNHDSGQKVIIHIGGMKANKNLMALLKAFAPLADDYPEWVIKVFGKRGDGKQAHKVEIKEFIKANHLENRVLIYGPTDDIFSEYANSHIHVISSLSEGCPTCVLEAMATGVPSIGFADCPGTNQLIRDKKNGFLAGNSDRVTSLSQALRQLMDSAELRAELGQQALEDAGSFLPEKIYDQWEKLFFEAAEYKTDPERLFREQLAIDPERAMHARRMLDKLMKQFRGAA